MTPRAPCARRIHGLDVLVVDADIADMGKGEGDDLPGIGRIGEDFLIAGHRGIEADFAHRLTDGAKAGPSTTVPSAITSTAVGTGSAQLALVAVHERPT